MFENLMALIASLFTPQADMEDVRLQEIIDTAPVGSVESLTAQVLQLQRRAKHANDPKVKRLKVTNVKVSEKGGINIFGLRRFPVNLYLAELEAILKSASDGTLAKFIDEHKAELSLAKAADESK